MNYNHESLETLLKLRRNAREMGHTIPRKLKEAIQARIESRDYETMETN